MPGVDLFLVPYSGGLEARLTALEAKSLNEIDDQGRATRLFELLDQRKMEVPFKFTDRGVLMHGTKAQAMIVHRLVPDLPNMTPSAKGHTGQTITAANDDADGHIATAFGEAARRFNVASVRPKFYAAANDEQIASVRWGSRPAINGSYGSRTLEAA